MPEACKISSVCKHTGNNVHTPVEAEPASTDKAIRGADNLDNSDFGVAKTSEVYFRKNSQTTLQQIASLAQDIDNYLSRIFLASMRCIIGIVNSRSRNEYRFKDLYGSSTSKVKLFTFATNTCDPASCCCECDISSL
ncbi:hypothetical protein HHI36_014704 [Cryptolaemus montrouzieri]|uniref:Uncharacterized protein n=1 Tax=Cryptolaemus montrouzieri TaxID=559131 RepID=A0ABD2N3J4_9CUCU